MKLEKKIDDFLLGYRIFSDKQDNLNIDRSFLMKYIEFVLLDSSQLRLTELMQGDGVYMWDNSFANIIYMDGGYIDCDDSSILIISIIEGGSIVLYDNSKATVSDYHDGEVFVWGKSLVEIIIYFD